MKKHFSIRSKTSSYLKVERRRFLTSVAAVKPTTETMKVAGERVTKMRAARQADFLEKYRVVEAA